MGMPGAEDTYECMLSPDLQRYALEELNEDPNRREEDIQAVREWLLKHPHLNARTDRRTILRYLRGCKFSLEKTKAKLDMYYTCKGALPDMFKGRDPQNPHLRRIIKMGLMFPLPGYDPEGRMVIFGRLGAWDPNKVKPEDLFKAAGMLFDTIFLEDEQVSIKGLVQANDMTGLTFKHVAVLPFPLIKKVSTTWQEGYPFRPKGVHYIYTPQAFDALFNLFKPLMREKMKKRVHLHGSNIESMHKYVPKSMLPSEYGGTAGTIQEIADYWLSKMDEHRDWFLEDEKHCADETRRPGKPKTVSDLFGGIEGSFRKLEFD
ncbi:retinol-binding protein pinta-like isoform X1 [Palaemon carinicauda]|uniref:retinol-binding protein pinta-like isoform X1 n=3 Tax=Palaemon carinicauda TaxID=392227 RepID=UPI0035B5F268